MPDAEEIKRRTAVALAAIHEHHGTEDDEYAGTLFVSHHIEELGGEYWQKHVGAPRPTSAQVLGALVLKSHWSADNEDGIDVFDFTLPDGATDYVLSVAFDGEGRVEDISMES